MKRKLLLLALIMAFGTVPFFAYTATDAERAQEIEDIATEAVAYDPGDPGFVTGFNTISEATGLYW